MDENAPTSETHDSDPLQADGTDKAPEASTGEVFDINTVEISPEEVGDFPYFELPEGYVYADPDHAKNGNGKGLTLDIDKEYFLNDGVYFPVEGKTFKGHINVDRDSQDKAFAPLELQKNFDELVAKMGGVKINRVKDIKREKKRE